MSSSTAAQDRTIFSGKVTPDWIERGVFLSKAALQFGHPEFADKARAAAERFAELRDGETPEMFEWSSLLSGEARDKELLDRLYGDQKEAWRDYYINRNPRNKIFGSTWAGMERFLPSAPTEPRVKSQSGFRCRLGIGCILTLRRRMS
jgi:hypothetical protein